MKLCRPHHTITFLPARTATSRSQPSHRPHRRDDQPNRASFSSQQPPRAAAAAAAAAALSISPASSPTNIQIAWQALQQAASSDPIGAIIGIALSIAAAALSAMMIAAIPALFALRKSAQAAEALLHSMREELPDTAAALRLSGLEMADAVSEVTALGSDLTEGVRASARAIVGAEQGLRDSIQFASNVAVPSLKNAIPGTKQRVESALKERSKLDTQQTLRETAGATKVAVKRLRTVLGAASVAKTALQYVQGQRRELLHNRRPMMINPYADGALSDEE